MATMSVASCDDGKAFRDMLPMVKHSWLTWDGCSSLAPLGGVLSFRSEAWEVLGSETPRVHRAARRRRVAGPRERHMGLTGLMGARRCSGSPYTSTSSVPSYPSSSYKQPFRS